MLIEESLYHEMRAQLPILCVDILLIHENRYLLLKRNNSPAKGQWWFPGGRVFKDEMIAEACVRKGREELGLDIHAGETVSVEESIFLDEAPSIHTVNIVVKASLKNLSQKIVLDDTHSEYVWFKTISPQLHPCVSEPLTIAGFVVGER